MSESFLLILGGVGASLIIFLVCRELICWYWKINRQVELLEKIYEELKKMPKSPLS